MLGRDDDRAVRAADAVERGRFRPLQHGERRDVVGIEVGRPVGEVDPAVRQRGVGVLVGRQRSRIEGRVVHRQPVHDDQRLIVAADRGDPPDGDRGRGAGHPRRARHVHAGDAPRQRIDEVFPLRLGDLRTSEALLRGPLRPLLGGQPQRGDDDGVETQRGAPQRHVDDDVRVVHGPFRQLRPDIAELQDLPHLDADRIDPRGIGRRRPVAALDGDHHAGERSVLLVGHLAGNGLLLCECVGSNNEEDSHQYGDGAFGHDDGYRVWRRLLRSQDARPNA